MALRSLELWARAMAEFRQAPARSPNDRQRGGEGKTR